MIKETIIRDLVEAKLKLTNLFLVDVKVRVGNKIIVYADGINSITIDECAEISKHIESHLDREIEDYELEVSSPGITQPLKVEKQYKKHLGKQLQVLMKDGIKRNGTLLNYDKDGFQMEEKTKLKGKSEIVISRLLFNDIKETKLLITF